MKSIFVTITTFFLCGCATSKIDQLSSDTYMISKADHSPGVGESRPLRKEVIAEAKAFAAKQGKVAVPVSIEASPAFPFHFASIKYQFQVFDKNDSEALRASEEPVPEGDFKKMQITPIVASKESSYDRLLKLNELKKKGIITQAEFNEQKKRILSEK